jgi:serine/arginine repetitive matrix protein 2
MITVSDAPSTFVRPKRANRARSNTYASSGADTPPLSAADNSSVSGGSESSIDVGHLTMLLSNVSHPANAWVASRPRARGHGHRRRISQARMSRSSVYETIEEEHSVILSAPFRQLETIVASPMPSGAGSADASQVINDSVVVVDSDADSPRGSVDWNPEHGISLRKYYTLKNEADVTVEESKRDWTDTAFSMFAVQCKPMPMLFNTHLTHLIISLRSSPSSRWHEGDARALADELRRAPLSSDGPSHQVPDVLPRFSIRPGRLRRRHLAQLDVQPLSQPILVQSNIPSNVSSTIGASPAKSTKSGKRSFKGNENMADKQSKNATIRPRVNSSARRSALGWVKRPSKSSDQKENTSAGSLTKSVSFF